MVRCSTDWADELRLRVSEPWSITVFAVPSFLDASATEVSATVDAEDWMLMLRHADPTLFVVFQYLQCFKRYLI